MPPWRERWIRALFAPEGAGGGEPGGGEDDGGGAGGGAGGGGDVPAGGGGGSSWRDALPDDLREHAALAAHGDIASLAKEHVNLQSLIGRKGVLPPDPKGGEAELTRFRADLAKVAPDLAPPESADKYDLGDFKPPEGSAWSEDAQKMVLGDLHKLGLTSAQARGVMDSYVEKVVGPAMQAAQEGLEQAQAALKSDWGGQFDSKINGANMALAAAGGEQLQDLQQLRLADGSFLGDNPAMVRLFARLHEEFGVGAEDNGGLPGRQRGDPMSTPEAAKAEISRIRSEAAENKDHPYSNSRHPEHKAMLDRVARLYSVAYPDKGNDR